MQAIAVKTPSLEEKDDYAASIEGAECREWMRYRQIPPDAYVIEWGYVNRHHSHTECHQTVSNFVTTAQACNFEQRKVWVLAKSIVKCKMCMSHRSVSWRCRYFSSERSSIWQQVTTWKSGCFFLPLWKSLHHQNSELRDKRFSPCTFCIRR